MQDSTRWKQSQEYETAAVCNKPKLTNDNDDSSADWMLFDVLWMEFCTEAGKKLRNYHGTTNLMCRSRNAGIVSSRATRLMACYFCVDLRSNVAKIPLRYRDSAGNTVEENSSVFSLIRMR